MDVEYLDRLFYLIAFYLIFRILLYSWLPSQKGFYNMLLNTNNEEYLKSFLSQQPMFSCFKIDPRYKIIKERHNFNYGSWKLEPSQFLNVENEVVIYMLKEKYILNDEANEKFKDFSQQLQQQVLNEKKQIEYNGTDTCLVLFNKKNSQIFNFLTGQFGQILYMFLRILGLHMFYEKLFCKLVDKYIEVPVVKNISMDKDEYQYKYNQFESGAGELKPRSKDDGEMTKLDKYIFVTIGIMVLIPGFLTGYLRGIWPCFVFI